MMEIINAPKGGQDSPGYYHLFANGNDSRNFIVCERDFMTAFNRMGVCAANCDVRVLSFSIEDSHPHALLYGYFVNCLKFKKMYESITLHHIISTRGSMDGVCFDCELERIDDQDHLKSLAAYTITQATKDGKSVMPYDYLWGTGSMYFRNRNTIPIWTIDTDGLVHTPTEISTLNVRERQALLGSKKTVPSHWLISNGFLLPSNYVDVAMFENIYGTHNCFRAFLSSGKAKDQELLTKMANARGIVMNDLEARSVCSKLCFSIFGKNDSAGLTPVQRMALAQEIRKQYRLSFRQIASIVRLPEDEIRKYVR